jgi:hypothetical protein
LGSRSRRKREDFRHQLLRARLAASEPREIGSTEGDLMVSLAPALSDGDVERVGMTVSDLLTLISARFRSPCSKVFCSLNTGMSGRVSPGRQSRY